jgi:protein SCO1/2
VVFLFIALGLAAVGVAIFIPLRQPTAASQDPKVIPPAFFDAPPFVLTERDGSTVDNTALDGKVWVASFAFTRCKFCPSVQATMARLRGEMKLKEDDDFRLVTFTIDPEYDTPDELKRYATRFTTEGDRRWLFLHGPERFIRLLCVRGFKVGVERNDAADASERYNHFLGLMVVDKKGRVRGEFLGKQSSREGDEKVIEQGKKEFDRSYEELKAKVTELLAEPADAP